MASKARGGLSKREFFAKQTGRPKEEFRSSGVSSGGRDGTLRALQSEFESTLRPSGEELAAERGIGELAAERERRTLAARQERVAQPFVTGARRNLLEEEALKVRPLEVRLASLSARRKAASDVLRSRLGFETDAAQRAEQARQFDEGLAFDREREARLAGQAERERSEPVGFTPDEQKRLETLGGSRFARPAKLDVLNQIPRGEDVRFREFRRAEEEKARQSLPLDLVIKRFLENLEIEKKGKGKKA